jgi:hypothetical protein
MQNGIKSIFSDEVFKLIGVIAIAFWMLHELFDDVHKLFLFLAVASTLAEAAYVLAHKIFTKFSSKLLCWVIYAILIIAIFKNESVPVDDPYRPLIPANDSFPPWPNGRQIISVKSNVVLFFFGGCVMDSIIHSHPIPLIVAPDTSTEHPFKPLLEVSIETNGASVSGQFFDKDGKIVVALRDNKPIINLSNSFDVQRPDASTLIVHDQYDVEVLNIRFLRPSVFMFTGVIHSPDGAELTVTRTNVVFRSQKRGVTLSKYTTENTAICIGQNIFLFVSGHGISN